MVRILLIRGMLVGILAGLLGFGVAKVFGEPQIDRAIAFEELEDHAAAGGHEMAGVVTPEPGAVPGEGDLVSRGAQSGIGLLTGVVVYGTALGGLFALAFAFVFGRIGPSSPRATAALLAAVGFIALVVVPGLKYPPNPPAVGDGATIGYRTGLHFVMLAIAVAATVVASVVVRRRSRHHGPWNAVLIGGAGFVGIVVAAHLLLPPVDEVPDGFPAVVLWRFRMASFGVQLVMWTAIGLLFGASAERVLTRVRAIDGGRGG